MFRSALALPLSPRARRLLLAAAHAAAILLLLVACQPTPPAPAAAPGGMPDAGAPRQGEAQSLPPSTGPDVAPGATAVPAGGSSGPLLDPSLPQVPYSQQRLIIKSGEIALLVRDADAAVDGVTQVAIDTGGYILSGRSWYDGDFKYAQITLAVPSSSYETALQRLRTLAVQVLRETSSGQDVTEEYVDLESRLRNLEVQAERLRAFMDQARNVQEAITVSQALNAVEAEIETIKGRMNFLEGRAAFSTITAILEPQRPTPTPTPTATPLPTPTSWSPAHTFERATGTSATLLQGLADVAIWLLVVGGPIAAPLAAIVYLRRRSRRRGAS
jgi:hypothetical protein